MIKKIPIISLFLLLSFESYAGNFCPSAPMIQDKKIKVLKCNFYDAKTDKEFIKKLNNFLLKAKMKNPKAYSVEVIKNNTGAIIKTEQRNYFYESDDKNSVIKLL